MDEVERLPWTSQRELDDASFRYQLAYLLAHSPFYRGKLAGHDTTGGLDTIATLPLTEKSELKATCSDENPFGDHLCVAPDELVRVYSTSGTTGTPSFIPLTVSDLDNWVTGSARSYAASGLGAGDRVVTTYNAGPFVAGAALDAFSRIGVCHVPIGTGSSERLLRAIDKLRPDAVVLTPSYAEYLLELGDLRSSTVRRVLVAGEPGGGEPAFRAKLQAGWGASVTEAMGIGDIGPSLFGECEQQLGMHLGARGLVHIELIDPDTGAARELSDGATGELVLTHLRHRAAPLLRFRTRDHVRIWTEPCACGRTAPRMRCVGRTDDMLIVRGVNVFPSAVREVVARFQPRVTGAIQIRPKRRGVKQEPPLPVCVEGESNAALAEKIILEIRNALTFTPEVRMVPPQSLPRSDYKSKLVDFSDAT